MEAEPGTEERAPSPGSGFHNHSDTNCAYLCSLSPQSCNKSSEQFPIAPIPDKLQPVTLLSISSQEQVARMRERNMHSPKEAQLCVNIMWIFTKCMRVPCEALHMSIYSESHLSFNWNLRWTIFKERCTLMESCSSCVGKIPAGRQSSYPSSNIAFLVLISILFLGQCVSCLLKQNWFSVVSHKLIQDTCIWSWLGHASVRRESQCIMTVWRIRCRAPPQLGTTHSSFFFLQSIHFWLSAGLYSSCSQPS